MASVAFLRENGDRFSFSADELEAVTRATAVARAWAAENGFETVSFIAREGEPLRFHVRIGEEAPLNAWVDGVLFAQGKTDELETVLDFARGEHRRRMAGYDHYDR